MEGTPGEQDADSKAGRDGHPKDLARAARTGAGGEEEVFEAGEGHNGHPVDLAGPPGPVGVAQGPAREGGHSGPGTMARHRGPLESREEAASEGPGPTGRPSRSACVVRPRGAVRRRV